MIEDSAAALIGLPPKEVDVLRSVAVASWYSIQSAYGHMQLAKEVVRVTELIIRADRVVCLESIEDILPEGTGKTFRLSIREAHPSEFSSADADPFAFTGETGSLENLRILPHPRQIQLLWNRFEYSTGKPSGHSVRYVHVVHGLVIVGEGGSVLVSQDELPTWLRIDWNSGSVGRALSEAIRVEEI